MTPDEFDSYKADTSTTPDPTIHVDEVPGPDRTLVYGYERVYDAEHNETTNTVHVYKRDGELHVVHYTYHGERSQSFSGERVPIAPCSPGKRAYPERCDLAFARLMRDRDSALCFTTFGSAGSNSAGTFAGRFIEDTHEPDSTTVS